MLDLAPPLYVRRHRLSRLSRRRFRLLLAGFLLAIAGSVGLAGPVLGGSHVEDQSVVVHSGDTLWSIASANYGDGDVRAAVDDIAQSNGLGSASIVPGQRLHLPQR